MAQHRKLTAPNTDARTVWQAGSVVGVAMVGYALLTMGHPATVAGSPLPAYTTCTEEDGSTPGQPFPCLWDATSQGNGYGQSYVLTMVGDDILTDRSVTGS